VDSIGDDAGVLSGPAKTMSATGEVIQPKESLKTAGIFFAMGGELAYYLRQFLASLVMAYLRARWD